MIYSKDKQLHNNLLTASYVLAAFSSLFGALAAIGVALENNTLEYPHVDNVSKNLTRQIRRPLNLKNDR